METLTMKFPHLSELIFDHLDNQSLIHCKIVCKPWSIYIGHQKFYGIRVIKETLKKFHKLSETWLEVFKKANSNTIMELRKCFDQFYEGRRQKPHFEKEVTPLHVTADAGNITLYEAIHKLAKNKQPRTEDGFEPVVYAMNKGHVKMTEFIMQGLVDKNPISKNGFTALHRVAKYGHVEICETILQHLEDKNPKCNYSDTTPLHVAASFGHFRLCELITKQIEEKNPRDVDGWTPLHEAAKHGHAKALETIMKSVQNKNPMSNWTRMTPLHLSAKYGHVEVCMLILQNVKNKNPRNEDGKTPLAIARENNQFKVCWLLEKIWKCVI